jgi:hypothetical protein
MTMNILMAIASRHGTTTGIADAIERELRQLDLTVDVQAAEQVNNPETYDAAIIGRAIYMGNQPWLSSGTSAPIFRRISDDMRVDGCEQTVLSPGKSS